MAQITVLHIEDEPSDRLIVSAAFKKMAPHLRLLAVIDGAEAVAYLAGEGSYRDREVSPIPDLILLDLKLPKKSGFEVLEWMKSQPRLKGIPVTVLSSSDDKKDIERAYALGANSYLVKNVDLKTMREFVRGIGESLPLASKKPGGLV